MWGRFALAVAFITAALHPAVHAAEPSGPAFETTPDKLAAALRCPAAFDDADHEPVLLVHGTFTNPGSNWGWNYEPGRSKASGSMSAR